MAKGTTFKNDLLQLIFNGVAISNIADNATTSPITNLYISLHTADPTDSGDQSTSECTYTGYARQALLRTSSGWTVTTNSVSPASDVDFPEATAGSETATHLVVGTDLTGTGKILYSGSISPTIAIAAGVIPRITTGTTITED